MEADGFAEWLQEELDHEGWNQADLARRSGLTTASISRIMTGSRGAGPDACVAIAKALDKPAALVLMKAGILPRKSPEEIDYEELKVLYSKLNDRDKNDVLDYIRMRIKRRQQIERSIRERYKFVPKDDPKALLAFIRDVLSEFGGYDEV